MARDWFKSKLSFILVKYILFIGIFFSILSTIFNIHIEYNRGIDEINNSLTQIEQTYQNPLSNSLWHLDSEQVKILVAGLHKIKGIKSTEIYEYKKNKKLLFASYGENEIENKIVKVFPLLHGEGKREIIGEAKITVSLTFLHEELIKKAIYILVSQTIQTFLVAFCILYLVYILVAKRIVSISQYAKALTHHNMSTEFQTEKKLLDEENEVDQLIQSLNVMRLNILDYIKNRDMVEGQLKQYKEHLEDLVTKRTKELHDKNIELEKNLNQINKIQKQLIAQEKLASLGSLTSGIAHEINNPLNFIINFSQIATQSSEELQVYVKKIDTLTDEQREEITEEANDINIMCHEILTHGKRAEQIIKSMLEHSRASNSEELKETEDIVLNELIEENINFAFHAMRAKYKSFNINITKTLTDQNVEFKGYKSDLARVFLNIFSNAFYSIIKKERMNRKSYEGELKVITSIEESNYKIVIEDNGQGIDSETLEKIFNPFYTTKPSGEGTGLGLSLSYDIITNIHGGSIKAEGQKDEFARFIITLPIKKNS